MREELFWLDDLQLSSIKGGLPSRKRRGPRLGPIHALLRIGRERPGITRNLNPKAPGSPFIQLMISMLVTTHI
jgi:hypothetical protein